ncbi:MAG: haloacid dehalogenase-like hydrolase [Hormoscilla sp. SP12CHS1]|nr:haloacid dehalogenase-like hydrolase [Hormoscilla sp. SP12CHS1]
MKKRTFSPLIAICLSCLLWLGVTLGYQESAAAIGDPLPSWQDGETKATIIDFVTDVTDPSSDNFVESSDRIAVFDNDGTLWSEHPVYFPVVFILEHGIKEGGRTIEEIVHRGMGAGETTEKYIDAASEFVTTKKNPEYHSYYVDLIYKPMVELLNYLQDNEFQVYICSGGDADFIRSFADEYYSIPRENVIGSLVITEFKNRLGHPSVVRSSDLFFYNDEEEKPVGIQRDIGKRPIMAVGNSNGDLQMLQYTDDGNGRDLMMLVRHDDEAREHYQEAADSDHVNEALDEADDRGWTLISVKDDFVKVFVGTDLP